MILVGAIPPNSLQVEPYSALVAQARYGVHMELPWVTRYCEAFQPDGAAFVLAGKESVSGILVGALPLQVERVRGTRFWTLRHFVPLSTGPADFNDVLAAQGREAEFCGGVVRWLLDHSRQWDVLDLAHIPKSSRTLPAFQHALHEQEVPFECSESSRFLRIDTTGSWEAYERDVLAKRFTGYRTLLNRMRRERIELTVETVRTNIWASLQVLLTLYAARRAQSDQKDVFEHLPAMSAFMEMVVRDYEIRGWAELTVLRQAEDTWAFALDWIHRGIRYHYMPAFDQKYKSYSPGKLVCREIIRKAFEDPETTEFNFMRGESPYKLQFAEDSEAYVHLRVTNERSWRVRATRAATRVADARDRVLRRRATR